MLFAVREVCIGKNCALGLEYGPRSAACSVFSNTDRNRPANNVFIFFYGIPVKGPKMSKILVRTTKLNFAIV